ncbi:MAG TPA: hypothetical protein VE999_19485 [Gemmataceae bacterium]|nr:hypothetical protein [Gemmataceae bacterium]
MRRRSSRRFGDQQFKQYNVRRDIDPKRLKAIGAMILQWNYLEGALNLILDLSLRLPPALWVPVHSRINGTDGKVALIKETFGLPAPIPEEAQAPIRKALNAVEHYKKYRDGIAHAFLTHPDQVVAESIQRKGMTDEVLLSQDALDRLNDHLDCLQGELDALAMIFHHRSAGFHANDSEREQLAEDIQRSMALLHHHQQMRESLEPLPEFSDQPQAQKGSAAAPKPAD